MTYQTKYLSVKNQEQELEDGEYSSPGAFEGMGLYLSPTNHKWEEAKILVKGGIVYIPEQKVKILELTKIKCELIRIKDPFYRLKIKYRETEEIYIAATMRSSKKELPDHYSWFAKIINAKLMSINIDLSKPFCHDKYTFESNLPNLLIKGKIYKKSQHLGNWCLRYVAINNEALYSYRDPKHSPTLIIKNSKVRGIWTRFDIHNGYLIIKMRHGV